MAWSADGKQYIPDDNYRFSGYQPGQPVHPFVRPGTPGLPPDDWAARLSRMPSAADTSDDTPCMACGGPTAAAGARYDGDWRLHAGCTLDAHGVVTALLRAHPKVGRGIELTPEDAELLRQNNYTRGLSFCTSEGGPRSPTYREGERHAKPWSFVTREQLERLREGIKALPSLRVKAGLTPSRCSQGPCAWCGRRLSRAWCSRDHHWADGSDAPLCQDCTIVYDRYRSDLWSSDWSTQRGALAECVSGVPIMLGEKGPDGLLAYAEIHGGPRETPVSGGAADNPWSHLDPATLDAYRWDRWGQYPRFAPEAHRAEAIERWARKQALREMRRRAAAKSEAARAQTYRFKNSQI